MREVPYVNERREVLTGTLISSLNMAGDQTRAPDTHVVQFDGDCPCNEDGQRNPRHRGNEAATRISAMA